MPDLDAAIQDLKQEWGDFLARNRPDGVFYAQIGGPGSVPALADLDVPEIHLDLLPEQLTDAQRAGLTRLGYAPEGEFWRHAGGWRLVLPDHTTGWRANQAALRELLLADAEAREDYRAVFEQAGRQGADEALRAAANAHHARTVGFAPAHFVARALAGLDVPWMFAAGVALDLHLGEVTRPHDDLDVVVPRECQAPLQKLLQDWRTDACIDGTYQVWEVPLEPPHHQIHARHAQLPAVIMLDLMLTDLSVGLWHYRRDPSITLPLEQARLISPEGLPYLAPEAVLLFKSATAGGNPRAKDQADFERVWLTLSPDSRSWLRGAIAKNSPGHGWIKRLVASGL